MRKESTEEQALVLMARDDSGGLRLLMERYTPYVSTVVCNIIGRCMTPQDVEEVVSDVFCALWRNRHKVQPGKVRGYLACMARGHAINRLRSSGRTPALELDELELSVEGPEARVLEEERRRTVHEAIDDMPAACREVFVRYYFYCQGTPDIARDMGLRPDTVRQRLKRGRDWLQNILSERGIDNA